MGDYLSVSAIFLMLSIIAMVFFIVRSLFIGKPTLLHKLYAGFSGSLVLWSIAVLLMEFVPEDIEVLTLLDAITNISVSFAPTFLLLFALAYTQNLSALPRKYKLLFVLACLTPVVVFTNPWHHLHYRVFSIRPDELQFGPYIYMSGAYSYLCMGASILMMMRFASKNPMYMNQVVLYSLGILVPFAASVLATANVIPMSIESTPLAFTATVVCHGIAINYMDFLDIKPIALQKILDNISDCYLIVDEQNRAIAMNKPFVDTFGRRNGIEINRDIYELAMNREDENKANLFDLVTSIESCRVSGSVISYEQPVHTKQGVSYYIAEVAPLIVRDQTGGFVVLYKDVTKLREDLKREQQTLSRTMERERLASLGQMIGGISHNLKTPIMSIAGSVGMLERLVLEYKQSIGDAEVTVQDHIEISDEMNDWLSKIQECCAYMSDIITTVKGLATNMDYSSSSEFLLGELFKRVRLLNRHDLIRSNCRLLFDEGIQGPSLHGDINNLVQVLNNLVSNAIDAMKPGGGEIRMSVVHDANVIDIAVIDQGCGVLPEVRDRLFREMVTSKGTLGTGLGLYTSAAIIRGKFGGELAYEDNPDGGSTFHIIIPIETENPQTARGASAAEAGMGR